MRPNASSLERLVPDDLTEDGATGHETLTLHLERYELASRHARTGRVLDIACGVGYGARLLRDQLDESSEIVGVDLSPDATAYASSRYGVPGLRFVTADALEFEDPEGFDTIVSLETIEHVPDPEALAARLVGMLRRSGVLIASVPTTPSVDVNTHHLSDFTERSYRRLFEARGLREIAHLRQVQPFHPWAVLRRGEQRMSDLRPNLLRYYTRNPAAAVHRLSATLRYGFTNRYLTSVWEHDDNPPSGTR